MEFQVIGTKKCRDTQKTERFFKERGIKYHFVDLNQRTLSDGELTSIIKNVGADGLIDTESKFFKKHGMSYMEFDPIEELSEHPEIMKTPVIRKGSKAVLGYNPELWEKTFKESF